MSDNSAPAQPDGIQRLLDRVSGIVNAHQSSKKLYDRRFAPDFNVSDFIAPDEAKLSEILAWFLDPLGTHKQGSHFLRLFLGMIGENSQDEECGSASVQREVSVAQGCLDILISTGHLRVIIENKPWAGDQNQQLARYFSYLDHNGAGNGIVIYLTPKGTAPSGYSLPEPEQQRRIEAQQLRQWGYGREILEWLARCRAGCQAERIRMFIDDFSRYISAEFQGIRNNTMSDHIIDGITESPVNVAAAVRVIILGDAVRKRLFEMLRQQLHINLQDHTVEIQNDQWRSYLSLSISYPENFPYKFRLEFQNTQFNGLIFGLHRNEENNPQNDDEIFRIIDKQIGPGKRNEWWLWYRKASLADTLLPVSPNWQPDPQPWIDIATGSLAERIQVVFKLIGQVLDG